MLILAWVLLFIGSRVSSVDPICSRVATRTGYGVFVVYCILAWIEFRPHDAAAILVILIRAGLIAGIAAGTTGLLMPICVWFFRTFISTPRAWFRRWRLRRMMRQFRRQNEREEVSRRKQREKDWERRRPERERAAAENKLQQEREATRRAQEDIVKALKDLEVRQRALLAAFAQNRTFLDEHEWNEATFLNFEWYQQRIRDGGRNEVFRDLQRISDSLQCDAMIGELMHQYEEIRPIIGREISPQMFSALIRGIPKESPVSTRSACDEIRRMLAASHHRLAPSYHAMQEEMQLDSLDAAMSAQHDPDEEKVMEVEIKIHRAVGE